MNTVSIKSARLLPKAGARARSGQMIVLVAVMLMAMIAILGLVVDSGLVHAARRQARRAADAAAQAGALVLCSGTNSTRVAQATIAASQYASLNGVNTNGYVAVQCPPNTNSGSIYAGSNGYIFVQVTLPVNTTFLRLLTTQQTVNVTAAATGGVKLALVPLTLLVLDPNDSGALSIKGGGNLSLPGGVIAVNSSSSTAVTLTGGSTLTCSNLNVVGGVSGASSISGAVYTGMPVQYDPMGYLTAPVITSSSQVTYGDGTTGPTSPDSGGTAASPSTASPSGTKTLRPGIYWGGIKITGGTITFNPGRYVLAGGGLSIGGSTTLVGTNVFFYNTRDPYSGGTSGDYGDVSIAGSGTITLKAPTATADPTYTGLLVFNDRASDKDINLSGGSSSATSGPLSGFIYGYRSTLKVTGGGYLGGVGGICNDVSVSGNAQFTALDISRIPSYGSAGLME